VSTVCWVAQREEEAEATAALGRRYARRAPGTVSRVDLAEFNALPEAEAEATLLACCGSRAFARPVAAGRPYASPEALLAAIESAFATLTWPDVLEAMEGHPRIGDRATGASAVEQSGVTDDSRALLVAGNAEYEERFGHVFLICATGLSGADMLAALRSRLKNDPATERAVATGELLKITVLRADAGGPMSARPGAVARDLKRTGGRT
jgi:2-oxo-4-hydroxy-4-carboxy-5-ureidoimidazoline decarboxylase